MLELLNNKFLEKEYDLEFEPNNASLFTTGNGYMGIRGSFEEFGSLRIQGAYIRGVFDEIIDIVEPFADNVYMKNYYFNEEGLKRFEYTDSIINFADILLIRFEIGGETFYPWKGEIISWERYLDAKNETLVRNVTWKNSKGMISKITFERFASFDNDHIYCIKATVTPINYSGEIKVISGIDTNTKTRGQKTTSVLGKETEGNRVYVKLKTGNKLEYQIGISCVNSFSKGFEDISSREDDGMFISVASVDAKENETYSVEKVVYVASSREEGVEPHYIEESYDKCYKAHYIEYKKVFDAVDIKITGDDKADSAVRFSNYHSIISVERNDSVHSLAAKGLTGEMYNNFVWWDCEVYQLPVFIHTMPQAAKYALMHRHHVLEQAKENAKAVGLKGAKFAFISSVKGVDMTPIYVRHPFMQIHVNADVAWGIINYYTVTGDDEFMKEYGVEVLCECCKFWASRVELKDGKYQILQVCGPDEHHPYVDNDAYTNYLVAFIMKETSKLCDKFGFDGDFDEIADKIYLPMEKGGMIPQFDGYFGLSRTLETAGGSNAKSFQMKTSGLYHKSQIIKQPDVLLLYSYLNFDLENSDYMTNFNYYEKMCESSSSLSYAPHSICAADNGALYSAYTHLMTTACIDLDDKHNCAWQGIHSGCAAGAWYSIFRGIAGIKCKTDRVEITPHMLPWWDKVEFSFVYRGEKIHIELTGDYILVSGGENADIYVNCQKVLSGKIINIKN